VKTKAAVHRDGDWHRSVYVWIVTPGDRILLQKRGETKKTWPGWWDVSSAGHLSAGESAVDAAIREVREELGIELRADELRYLATTRDRGVFDGGSWIENEIHEVYAVRRALDAAALRLEPDEVVEVALVDLPELDRADVVPHAAEIEALRRWLGRERPGQDGNASTPVTV
jgi:isopentenyldiphosphate isomerase